MMIFITEIRKKETYKKTIKEFGTIFWSYELFDFLLFSIRTAS
jgi:hypothetical protein